MQNIYIQIIGVIALIFWIISIQTTDKKKIFKIQNIANIFYSIQYLLLGAFSASAMNAISLIRGFVFLSNENKNIKNSKFQLFIFFSLIIILGFITFDNWYSIIPIIITLAYTYSTWQKNTKIIRIVFLLAAIGWIVYNMIVKAYAPLIGNTIELISGIIAIIKFDILKKEQKKL